MTTNLDKKISKLCTVWGKDNTYDLLKRIDQDKDWHRTDCSMEAFLDELISLLLIGDTHTVDCAYDFYLKYKETLLHSLKTMNCAMRMLETSFVESLKENFSIRLKWYQKIKLWVCQIFMRK